MDLNLLKRILTKRYSLHELSFPVLALIAASVLLFFILGVMTFQNFNREKKLLKDHLFRQGLTLIRALEAGARTGMMERKLYLKAKRERRLLPERPPFVEVKATVPRQDTRHSGTRE